jgi:hypothetical protein
MKKCETDVEELAQRFEVKRRKSLRALPVLTIALLCALTLVALLPGWGTAVVAGLIGFPWVGDVMNVVWITWKLRRLRGG